MRHFSKLSTVAVGAIALAGCQTLVSPEDYRFEQVGQRTPTAVSVRLVHAGKDPVVGANLFSVRWTNYGPKTPVRQQLAPLESGDQETFVYRGAIAAGDTLRLAALITPDGAPIYGSVEVH